MKKTIVFITALIGVVFSVNAADQSENGVFTSPLTTYSAGLSVGGLAALNQELRDESKNFLEVSFVNSVRFRDRVNVFFDINWFAPGLNFGGNVGIDYLLSKSDVKPFIGAGIGATHFDKNDEFDDNIGPSATVHAGCILELNESVQLRFRVPYTVVVNHDRDQYAGVEIGLLFSDKFKRVKKLEYNR